MCAACNPQYSFLIVEGADDRRFWNCRVDNQACLVINATCKSVGRASVGTLNEIGHDGHLGVFDRDYDDAFAVSSWKDNMVFWDAHSLEVVLFFSGTFRKLTSEQLDQDSIQRMERTLNSSLFDHIVRLCTTIGRIRFLLYQSSKDTGDDMEAFHPRRFVDDSGCLLLDEHELQVEAVRLGAAPSLAQLRNALNALPTLPVRQFVRGHDLAHVTSMAIHACGGKCNAKEVERTLRVGYECEELNQTTVYAEVREWEAARAPFRILKN